MKKFFLNLSEKIAYCALRRVLLGYVRVFGTGLFALETRQDKFESEVKQVADVFVRSIVNLDARLKALESKGGQ